MLGNYGIYWIVKVGKTKCLHETFLSAYHDYKSHEDYLFLLPNKSILYPKIMLKSSFESLKEFDGW